HDDGRPRGAAARGTHRAGGEPGGALRAARHRLRGVVHRRPAHEPDGAGRGCDRGRAPRGHAPRLRGARRDGRGRRIPRRRFARRRARRRAAAHGARSGTRRRETRAGSARGLGPRARAPLRSTNRREEVMKSIWHLVAAGLAAVVFPAVAADVEVTFYYPVAVGGPITKIVDGYAADFEKENPGIKVKPVYAGTYQETLVKALTAHKSGTPPVTAVLLSTDMFTLIDEDAIVPFDGLLQGADDHAWVKSFYPAFMANSQTGGKTWGIPFQRSTIVLYWDKALFKEAGLDPEHAPASWSEMLADARKLTRRDAAGHVTQWGVQIPSSGFPYW